MAFELLAMAPVVGTTQCTSGIQQRLASLSQDSCRGRPMGLSRGPASGDSDIMYRVSFLFSYEKQVTFTTQEALQTASLPFLGVGKRLLFVRGSWEDKRNWEKKKNLQTD